MTSSSPIAVRLSIPAGLGSELARTVLSVQQQTDSNWQLFIDAGSDADVLAAAEILAAADDRIQIGGQAPDQSWMAFIDAGTRWPSDFLARARLVPETGAVLVADRLEQHGHRLSLSRLVPASQDCVAAQVVLRDQGADWRRAVAAGPIDALVGDPVVVSLFDSEPEAALVTAIIEVSQHTAPLSLRKQIDACADIPTILCFAGASRGLAALTKGVPVVRAKSAAATRAKAVARAETEVVTFLPGGWEITSAEIVELARRLRTTGANAMLPVARDAQGSILGAGLVWADHRSRPTRFLQQHPIADAQRRPTLSVPAASTEGLTVRTTDVPRSDAPAPWWAIELEGPILVATDISVDIPRFTPPWRWPPGPATGSVTRVQASAAAFRQVDLQPVGLAGDTVVVMRAHTKPRARRWAITIGAPPGRRADNWGDVFFAEDTAEALRRAGQDAVIDREGASRATSYLDDVILNIRGLAKLPRHVGKVNLLWIISHPDQITAAEVQQYDAVFAASLTWSAKASQQFGMPVHPLLQATNPQRFHPSVAEPDTGPDILFVGNSRHQFRPIIADAKAAGLRPTLIGADWEQFLPADEIAATGVANAELPPWYRSAGVVLNDHFEDMAREGFINNRVFDVVAAGGRVISDPAAGLADVFGEAVATYHTAADLAALCDPQVRSQRWPAEQVRAAAAKVANEHSFDARVAELIAAAERLPLLSD